MTLTQLRAFLAAFEHGTFTAAAAELGVQQSSISELIARLESEVGLKLFTRGGRRLVPTAAAHDFHSYALRAVVALEDGMESLNSIVALEGGVSTFGILRSADYYNLADLVERFHGLYPKVRVRLVGLNSAFVAESIAAGEIECGLVVLPLPHVSLSVRPLFQDEVVYASTTRPKSAGRVTIEEMSRRDLVLYDAHAGWKDPTRRQLHDRADAAGVAINPTIEVESMETAINLVATGIGDTIVTRTIASSPAFPSTIRTFSFDPPLYDTLAIAQREGAHLAPATQKMAQLVEQILLSKTRTD